MNPTTGEDDIPINAIDCAIKTISTARNDNGLRVEAIKIKYLRRLYLVGSARFELATYGLRVRCSTS